MIVSELPKSPKYFASLFTALFLLFYNSESTPEGETWLTFYSNYNFAKYLYFIFRSYLRYRRLWALASYVSYVAQSHRPHRLISAFLCL